MTTTISGSGGAKTIAVAVGDKLTVTGFGAFGTGAGPDAPGELDTLQFLGAGMTAQNLLLAQSGGDVVITFDGIAGTKVTLVGVTVEQLENVAGAGNLQFFGEAAVGDGIDVWSAAQAGSQVALTGGTTVLNDLANTVAGKNTGDDTIDGRGGDDVLSGLGGNDTLRGGEGDDRLNGGTGADRMEGGNGNDTYVVDDLGDTVTEAGGPAAGVNTVLSGVNFTLGANVENLTLTGHADSIGIGNGLANVITGNDGSNTLLGGGGNDTLAGNAGFDYLYGGAGNDTLDGGAGNDTLDGGTGADVMNGGRGGDAYYVDNVGDQVIETLGNGAGGGLDAVYSAVNYTLGANLDYLILTGHAVSGTGNALNNGIDGNQEGNVLAGGGGDDVLDGKQGDDALSGGAGNDQLQGGSGRDALTGDEGDDVLQGGIGADILQGGAGNDTLDGGTSGDVMIGDAGDDRYVVDSSTDKVIETLGAASGGGIDTVTSSISYTLGLNVENLELWGYANLNGTGNSLDNTISGNFGANRLSGGAGNDTLIGADGDTLLGGSGNDTLVVQTAGFKLADGGAGIDTLKLDAIDGTADLTGALGAKLSNIEIVDLGFNGSGLVRNLVLDANTVFNLAGSNGSAFGDHTLMVKGDVGQSVTLDDGWTVVGAVQNPFGQAGAYNELTKDGATLLVESDVAIKGVGTDFDLGALNGSNGFRIDGAGYHANGTWLANIGDLNGDGYNDLLLGDPIRYFNAGGATIIYGHAGGFPASIDADAPNVGEGTRINLPIGSSFGNNVSSAGDLNGDGYADLLIGWPAGSTGSALVLFGHSGSFGSPGTPTVYEPLLGNISGFTITGFASGDSGGRSLASIGDINGDGFDDIIVGAPGADPNGLPAAGSAYVLFGHAGGFGSSVDVSKLDGTSGFRLDGSASGFVAGYGAGAGDVNGDGYADFLVGGFQSTAVVFGHGGGFTPTASLGALDGSNGFIVAGGQSVAGAGDINGDGFDDVIIGNSGMVVFGHAGSFDPSLTAAELNGSNGFRLAQTGDIVAKAGDVNGDGYDDLLVSRPTDAGYKGEAYVMFGHEGGFDAQLDLNKLTLDLGFRLVGLNQGDVLGAAVSAAGDLNGDGYDDIVVGANGAQPDGQSYVIFGGDFTGTAFTGSFGTAGAEDFIGTAQGDVFYGGGGKDSFEGAGGDDQIHVEGPALLNLDGGAGNDTAFLEGMGPSIDLTGALRGAMSNVETISLIGGGANTLKLDTEAVAALVGGEITANGVATLRINTDSSDTIAFSGDWTNLGDQGGYMKIANGSLTVLVSDHAHLQGVGQALPDLSKLDGTNGFAISSDVISAAGAGDLNGDGYSDVIVGSGGSSGKLGYVVYGHAAPFQADVNAQFASGVTTLSAGTGGTNMSGWSVSAAGDVNGDGYDDAIIGVPQFGTTLPNLQAGSAFVVFGGAGGLGTSLDLPSLTGSNGFQFLGTGNTTFTGWSVAGAGDVNGDGFDDVLIGTDPGVSGAAGQAYLLFGHGGAFAADITAADLDGSNGVVLSAGILGEMAGHSVASAGDINGDGYADIILGGRGPAAGGKSYSGESFVVFGHAGSFDAALNLDTLNGSAGFKIAPVAVGDTGALLLASSTNVASAGDINGDGYDDLVVGVYAADPSGKLNSGSTYVVFGHAGGFAGTLDLATLDAAHGFRLDGAAGNDASGWSVAGAGDVNGDGYADLLVSAHLPISAGGTGANGNAGEAYVVFGHAGGFGDHIDLSTLHGDAGFQIAAPSASNGFGMTVAPAGDVNGDGFADIAISDYAQFRTYIVFGGDFTGSVTHQGTAAGDELVGTPGADVMVGGDNRDYIYGNGGKDEIQGGGGSDVIHVQFPNSNGEPYSDLNSNGQYDFGEPFNDLNGSGTRDAPGSGPAMFAHVDGGAGYDFLLFDSGGSLDFGDLDHDPATSDRGKISNIEALNFNNGFANDITLHKADVLDMNPTDNHYIGNPTAERFLVVQGDGADTLHLSAADNWSPPDTGSLAGYAIYSSQEVKVAVDVAVHVVVG